MFKLTLTDDNDEKTVINATMRDILVWEKAGRDRSLSKLEDNYRLQDFYAIAHIAAKRTQVFSGDLKEFEETYDLRAEQIAVDNGVDPTRPAPSPEG